LRNRHNSRLILLYKKERDTIMCIKIAITYEKGGVAKTTTAVNVSAILAEQGYRVLLIDLDPQSYASAFYSLQDESIPNINDVMQRRIAAKDTVQDCGFFGLQMIPSYFTFEDIDDYLYEQGDKKDLILKKTLQDIEPDYDFIIMDCPPSGKHVKTNAMAFADYVILPTLAEQSAIQGLLCLSIKMVDIVKFINPSLSVLGVLIVMDERTFVKRAYKAELQSQDIFPCFSTTIRKNTKLQETSNAHQPINVYEPKSNGCQDYKALTEEILAKLQLR